MFSIVPVLQQNSLYIDPVKSIGTASRDYSTVTAWEADSYGVNASYHATGEMYADSTFSELMTIDDDTPLSITLTAASTERHDGTEGTGVKNSYNGAVCNINLASSITIDISWIECYTSSTSIRVDDSSWFCSRTANVADVDVHHLIVSGVNAGFNKLEGIRLAGTGTETFRNSILYDVVTAGAAGNYPIVVSVGGSKHNLTVYNSGNTSVPTDGWGIIGSCTNCFCDYVGTDRAIQSGGTTNATTDNTGGGLTNLTASDQFVSVVSGSEDLHLKDGSVLIEAGTDLETPGNIDINGSDRNSLAGILWSIGAHQKVIRATIGTSSRDYSTITAWESASYGATAVDDAVGDCYNDSTFTESVTLNDTTPLSVTLQAASGQEHDGTSATGVRISGAYTFTNSITGIASTVRLIEFDGNSSYVTHVYIADHNTADGHIVERSLIYNNIGTDGADSVSYGFQGKRVGAYNLFVYNIENTSVVNKRSIGIDESFSTLSIRCCTVFNCVASTSSGSSAGVDDCTSVSNTICIDNEIDFDSQATGESYNLSSDATAAGTGSLTNQTASDVIVSTTGGSEDLHLKLGSSAINAGTDLGAVANIDINGFDRDTGIYDPWDIGAHEYQGFVPRLQTWLIMM